MRERVTDARGAVGTGAAAAVDRGTPSHHDRVIDLIRAAAILGVVLGHWLIDEFYTADGQVLERSNLGQVPSLWPLTWVFMVMPLFFFVGGWSNKRSWDSVQRHGLSYGAFLDRRMHRLLGPTLVYLGVLFGLSVLARLRPELLGGRFTEQTAALATQPLWFLGVYLAVIALTPVTLAAHRAWGWGAAAALVALAVAIDAVRFGLGVESVGLVNVLVVWVLVHQFGYLDADGRFRAPVAAGFAIVGFGMLSLLVALGPYPARMVGAPGDSWSNIHPPNLALLALAIGQIGVVELLRPALARLLLRPRPWLVVVMVNTAVMSLYLWHQVAHMVAAALLLPLGWPVPAAGSAGWWAATIGMVLASATVLAAIVAVVRPAEHRPAPRPMPPQRWRSAAAAVAVSAAALGLLALAGTTVTRLAEWTPVLGPLHASPLLGLVLVVAAAGTLAALRRSPRPADEPRAGGAG